MKDHEEATRDDRDDDRDIRSLMRDSDYGGRLRDEFKRDLLRELNHNFTYHRRRARALVVAVVMLAAVGVLWHANDVGSDSFDLVRTGRKIGGGEVVEAPMSGMRFNTVPVAGDTDGGLAATQEVYAQVVAGDAKLLGIETWTIDDQTVLFQRLEVLHNGEPTEVMRVKSMSRGTASRLKQIRAGSRQADLAAIAEGRLAPHRTETLRFQGRDFTMGVWSWDTPTDGRVTYKRSLPVADLP